MAKQKRVALFIRTTSDGQTAEAQSAGLKKVAKKKGWKVVKTIDGDTLPITFGRGGIIHLKALLKRSEQKEIDLIAVWSVDRLGHSLKELIAFLEQLYARQLNLYLHQQKVDTTTASGKALFPIMALFAEFEHVIIQERIRVGLQRAKNQGKPHGRPRITAKTEQAIRIAWDEGMSVRKISKEIGCGIGTVMRVIRHPD